MSAVVKMLLCVCLSLELSCLLLRTLPRCQMCPGLLLFPVLLINKISLPTGRLFSHLSWKTVEFLSFKTPNVICWKRAWYTLILAISVLATEYLGNTSHQNSLQTIFDNSECLRMLVMDATCKSEEWSHSPVISLVCTKYSLGGFPFLPK